MEDRYRRGNNEDDLFGEFGDDFGDVHMEFGASNGISDTVEPLYKDTPGPELRTSL